MRRFVFIFISFILLLFTLASCRKDKAWQMSIGLRDNYAVERLKTLTLESGVESPAYQWIVLSHTYRGAEKSVGDTISRQRQCLATFQKVGIYRMKFVLDDPKNRVEKLFNIWVDKELSEYSQLALEVLSYRPAPGPYVNYLPLEPTSGDVQERLLTMQQHCVASLRKENEESVTLGAFGGSIVLAFDHLVVNKPNGYDFQIKRDIRQLEGLTDVAVWVAYDKNRNGVPDEDEWYYLYSDRKEQARNFSVTYSPGNNTPATGDDAVMGFEAAQHVKWTTSDSTGYIPRLKLNYLTNSNYMPSKWLESWTEPYVGVRFENRAKVRLEYSIDGSNKLVAAATELGFLPYNAPPKGAASNIFGYDIDWAVDANGVKVHLPGIHFVRIVNATHEVVPKYGALGASILSVRDLTLY